VDFFAARWTGLNINKRQREQFGAASGKNQFSRAARGNSAISGSAPRPPRSAWMLSVLCAISAKNARRGEWRRSNQGALDQKHFVKTKNSVRRRPMIRRCPRHASRRPSLIIEDVRIELALRSIRRGCGSSTEPPYRRRRRAWRGGRQFCGSRTCRIESVAAGGRARASREFEISTTW